MAPAIEPANPLRDIRLFAGLDAPALTALEGCARRHDYAAGEVLFREGEACAGLFLITAGAVRIFKLSPSGRELTLHVEHAPAGVAEVPLVDGGPYPASVQAVTPVQALLLPRKDFLDVCRRHPQVALRTLAVFGQRMRGLVNLLEAVTFGGLRQRLARTLLEQARGGQHGPALVSGSQQELAQSLGTVREVVARNLGRFQAEGWIRIGHREIEVLDPEGLRREAEIEL